MKHHKVNKETLSAILSIFRPILTKYEKARLCAFDSRAIREAYRLYKLAGERVIVSPIEYLIDRAKEYSFSANIKPDYNLAKELMKHYQPPSQEKEKMYEPCDETTPLRNRIWSGNSYSPATATEWNDPKKISDHLNSESSKKLKRQGIDIEAFMVACGSRATGL